MLACKLFGHKYRQDGSTYLKHAGDTPPLWTDGIGRAHVQLYVNCERCGDKISIGKIHTDANGTLFSKDTK